jgi:DNA-binding PadR family transcriptional regulator
MLYDISQCIISQRIILEVMFMPYNGGPMTEAMYYVLLALMNPNHGYRLMNAITEVSNGRLNMGPGTLYGVLTRMQKDGLISLSEDDGRRKTYAITRDGEEALRQEYKRLRAAVRDGFILQEGDGDE